MVQDWCRKWRLDVNLSKTNILHVRNSRKTQSKFVFLFNNRPVAYCKHYTYLGITLNEFLDFKFTCQVQADSAGRALSSIVTKMIKNGGFPFNIYSLLYETCVTSISDYGGEIFGYTEQASNLNLHLRAIRAFIGVPKNSTKAGVLSEVDWMLPKFRTQIRMIRYYNRILKMPEDRLCKKVFTWDKDLNLDNWSNEVKSIFYQSEQSGIFDAGQPFYLQNVLEKIKIKFQKSQRFSLELESLNKPKLRTFLTIKDFEKVPAYITKPLSFIQRKFLAKCRLGCLPIRLETGRFCRPIFAENERICQVCQVNGGMGYQYKNEIESEIHLLFNCNRYDYIRSKWFEKLTLPPDYILLNKYERLKIVLNDANNVKFTAQFIIEAMNIRGKASLTFNIY